MPIGADETRFCDVLKSEAPIALITKRCIFAISGLLALFLLGETILNGYAYYHAISDGALDAVGIAIQHPEVINRVGTVASYRVFFWSPHSTTEGGRTTFRVRVFVSGESGHGAANVGLYQESGGSWSAFRLDFLTKGQTVSVPDVKKWYNALQNQVKSRPLPRRELPIPISPGIISTGVAAGVMGVWLLILGAYARWLVRLRRSRKENIHQV